MFLYKLKWVKKEKSYFCLLFLNLKYFRTTKKVKFFPLFVNTILHFFVDFILLISLDKCITCSAQIHILKKIIHNILGSISQKFNNQHQMYFSHVSLNISQYHLCNQLIKWFYPVLTSQWIVRISTELVSWVLHKNPIK